MKTLLSDSQIAAAGFLFEWSLTNRIGQYELSLVTAEGLQDADPDLVATQIRDVLDGDSDLNAEYRASCFWALGKRCDADLLEFFLKHLAIEVSHDMRVAYQIMIALQNLGEHVWPDDCRGFSVLEENFNRGVATAYLRKRMIVE